jgi:hypothetical protein
MLFLKIVFNDVGLALAASEIASGICDQLLLILRPPTAYRIVFNILI